VTAEPIDRSDEIRQLHLADEMADRGEQHTGQVRMAYRLGAANRDQLLHVHGIGWHYWDGKRWDEDNRGHAKRAVLNVLRAALSDSLCDKQLRSDVQRCESDNGIKGTLGIASALDQFAATADDLDPDPYLLNVANGVLDLRTLELSPHDPRHRMTKVTKAAYRPSDGLPGRWQTFLEQVLPDADVRDYVQRLAGIALTGKVFEHVLPIFQGGGGNGKGTFYTALLHALGDYGLAAEPNLLMHQDGAHPTGEMDLMGKRFVVVSETQEGRRLNEATMKRLTGGDPVRARRMRQDFIQFDPSHTAVLVTNHLPLVSGDSKAVWDRLRVVPFKVSIRGTDQDDKRLPETLQLEADAILSWAVAGWADYQKRGGMDEPDAVRIATDAYQADSDTIKRFTDECCLTESQANKATTEQLFTAFQKWRQVDGAADMTKRAFGQALDSKGYAATKGTGGTRWRHGIAVLSDRNNPDGE
jgi:putative DNA primase/helicase